MLELAKAIPFAETNKQVVEYEFPKSAMGADKERQYFIMLINLRANLLHDKDRRSIIAP